MGSQATQPRGWRGKLARQMSSMIWSGIHKLTTGTIQPQNVQPRAKR